MLVVAIILAIYIPYNCYIHTILARNQALIAALYAMAEDYKGNP